MDNYKKKPKEPVQPEPVEIPTNNAPEDFDVDNTKFDLWAEILSGGNGGNGGGAE